MGILDDDVARVRESTDLVALAGEHIALKRVGRGSPRGCRGRRGRAPGGAGPPGAEPPTATPPAGSTSAGRPTGSTRSACTCSAKDLGATTSGTPVWPS